MSSSESELSDSDVELQEAFAEGRLKPGLSIPQAAPKQFANNKIGLNQKLKEFRLDLDWSERLDSTNKEAPLAPELAAQLLIEEQKRENQLKNNKKLPQYAPSEDPVLNDFKREMMFHRQAQAAVLEVLPKLKQQNILTRRPEDYFAEMAKTDEHMQKIRKHLMVQQEQQKRSERVKQLRTQRKEGKMLQIQSKLKRHQDKKEMLDQVKKVRKGLSKDLDFLDGKKSKAISRKSIEKRRSKDKKFGFGGRKKGGKMNTKESAADISEYRRPGGKAAGGKGGKGAKGKFVNKNKRPGKNRRAQSKGKGRK